MTSEKGLRDEIELARKHLEEDIHKKELEAEEKLDDLLSRKRMEFCSRCGKKIDSRMDWGGECLHEGCDQLICHECWVSEEKRFCRKHIKDYVKKEEETVETIEGEIKNLTLNYMNFIKERFRKFELDWNHEGLIGKTKIKVKKKGYRDFEMIVYKSGFLSKKPKVRVLVRPVSRGMEDEVNGVLEDIGEAVYIVMVFIGNSGSISQKDVKFAEAFSNSRVSLFLGDLESGKIYFNPKEGVTKNYSSWFDPTKVPMRFWDLLKSVSESVSGRKIVSSERFGEGFGITKEGAGRILRGSELLEEIEGTDSFILRE